MQQNHPAKPKPKKREICSFLRSNFIGVSAQESFVWILCLVWRHLKSLSALQSAQLGCGDLCHCQSCHSAQQGVWTEVFIVSGQLCLNRSGFMLVWPRSSDLGISVRGQFQRSHRSTELLSWRLKTTTCILKGSFCTSGKNGWGFTVAKQLMQHRRIQLPASPHGSTFS